MWTFILILGLIAGVCGDECIVYLRSKSSPSLYVERDDIWQPYLHAQRNRTWDVVPGLAKDPSDGPNVVSFRLRDSTMNDAYYLCSAVSKLFLCQHYEHLNEVDLTFGFVNMTIQSDVEVSFMILNSHNQYIYAKDSSVYIWLGSTRMQWAAEIVTGCYGLFRPALPTVTTLANTNATIATTNSTLMTVVDICHSTNVEDVRNCLNSRDVVNHEVLTSIMEAQMNNVPKHFQDLKLNPNLEPSARASSIMNAASQLEETGLAAARKLANGSQIAYYSETLVFEASRQMLPFVFPSNSSGAGSSIVVTGSRQHDNIPMVGVMYSSDLLDMASEVEIQEDGVGKSANETKKYLLNSNVISAHVDSAIDHVTITLYHANKTRKEIRCAFWNKSFSALTSARGFWSTKGCQKVSSESNDAKTVCSCDHLTNFALLVSVRDVQISEGDRVALQTITIVCSSISLAFLALGIIVFIFIMFGERRHTRHILHLNLMIALLIAQLIFITGIEASENQAVCKAVAYLLHYFLLASFGWMLVEGLYLYFHIVKVFSDGENKIWHYLLLAWGSPAVIIIITGASAHSKYGGEKYCWFAAEEGAIWAFIGPVLGIILVNTVILIMVISQIVRLAKRSGKLEHVRVGVRSSLILLPILGVTWIFGILSFNSDTIVFQYIFALCNSLQGGLIALFHCFCNTEVRYALKRRCEIVLHSSSLSKRIYSIRRTRQSSNSRKSYDSSHFSQYTIPPSPVSEKRQAKGQLDISPTSTASHQRTGADNERSQPFQAGTGDHPQALILDDRILLDSPCDSHRQLCVEAILTASQDSGGGIRQLLAI